MFLRQMIKNSQTNEPAPVHSQTQVVEPTVATVEKDYSSLGRVWEKGGHRRLYLDSVKVAEAIGLEYFCYNTGNISYAEYNGEKISNSRVNEILLSWVNAYFDLNTGKLYGRGKIEFADEIIEAYNKLEA